MTEQPLLDADVYAHLRAIAARIHAGRPNATLHPTALVHEAWVRLAGHPGFESRHHMVRAAALAMRQILVDDARARGATKRGGGDRRTTLSGLVDDAGRAGALEIDTALVRLEAVDPEAAEVALLRCFGGLTLAETAAAVGVSERTVSTRWRHARAWLLDHLELGDRG